MKKGKIILAYLLMAGILFGDSMSVFATEKVQTSVEKRKEEESEKAHVITEFHELENAYYEWQEKYPLEEVEQKLPKTLTVTTDKKQKEEIPVTWNCMDDYTNTQLRVYEFLPYWDEDKYLLSNELDEYWDVPYVQVSVPLAITAHEQADIDVTRKALASLLDRYTVQAVIYLCEEYEVKQKPAISAQTEISLKAGTTVQIADVAIDEYRNVWYGVKGDEKGKTFTGYIEKKNLAYASEVFREWEEKYAMVFTGYNTVEDKEGLSESADVQQFPLSYQAKLNGLKKKHPNWIFVKQNINLDWEIVTEQEYSQGRSIIDAGMGEAYQEKYYGPGRYYATKQAVCYYMDPRNFLDDTSIFQFEQMTFNPSYHSRDAVENILKNTFMDGNLPDEDISYAGAIYRIGSDYEISPYYLVSRILQVQNGKATALVSGEYEGYEGYYNYFHMGAPEGKVSVQVIQESLAFAKEKAWDGSYMALDGGCDLLLKEYIGRGQDTLYLQKFDVAAPKEELYLQQYTQNISAPYKEAFRIKAAYESTGAEDEIFVFKIPVYENMPDEASPLPRKYPVVTATKTQEPEKEETEVAEAVQSTAKPSEVSEENEEADEEFVKTDGETAQKEHKRTAQEQTEFLAEQIATLKDDTARKKTVVLESGEEAIVYKETLKMIKEQDIQLEIPVHENVIWLVDGSRILSDTLSDIDFSVKVGESKIPSNKLSEWTLDKLKYTELSLAHEGVFGFDAVFEIKLPEAKQGQYANLFYYNEQDKRLEFVCAAPVSREKVASFTFIHASDYVIILNDIVMEKVIFEMSEEQLQQQQIQKQLELAEKRAGILTNKLSVSELLKMVGALAGILIIGIGIGLLISKKSLQKNKKDKKK